MSRQAMPQFEYEPLPQKTEGVEYLAELALDLCNTWDHGTDEIWKTLEPELWALTRNPWLVLQTASRTKLKTLVEDKRLQAGIQKLLEERKSRLNVPLWFAQTYPNSPLGCVA